MSMEPPLFSYLTNLKIISFGDFLNLIFSFEEYHFKFGNKILFPVSQYGVKYHYDSALIMPGIHKIKGYIISPLSNMTFAKRESYSPIKKMHRKEARILFDLLKHKRSTQAQWIGRIYGSVKREIR